MLLVASLLLALAPAPRPEPSLSRAEQEYFLETAPVVDSRLLGKGSTEPWLLTLSDGSITHDAVFQNIDEKKPRYRMRNGRMERFFVDSYRYNIAAYRLAELLGLAHMVPVTVERTWKGRRGALSWWVESKWDGLEYHRSKIPPPDPEAFGRQLYRMRVFSQLVHDTDRNLGNLLITEDWKCWMIDFTRAFRRWKKIQQPDELVKCDRNLLENLRELDEDRVHEHIGPYLTGLEIRALMARRDLIVEHFEERIEKLGEDNVLY